jgi:hypothetical protein
VVLTKQSFRSGVSNRFVTTHSKQHKEQKWALELDTILSQDLSLQAKVKSFDADLIHFPFYSGRAGSPQRGVKELEEVLPKLIPANTSLISTIVTFNPELMHVSEDITAGQTYNIIPSRVKLPEDSAKPPGIARDGSGLSATLYALKRRKLATEGPLTFFPHRKRTLKSTTLDTLKPAFLVEGKMEQLIVQALCQGAPVRLINCNGDNVTLEAIARRAGTLCRLLQKKYRPLIIIFDREGRTEPAVALKASFTSLLVQEGITSKVIVGIPDRMIENWILADFDVFCTCAGIPVTTSGKSFEGLPGEKALKGLLPKRSDYVKTIHGVKWFLKCNPETMKKASTSFQQFCEALSSVTCKWLDQRELF